METRRIAVVIGSTREGRFGPTVAHWFASFAAQRPDVEIDLVDLLEPGVPGPRFSFAIAAADGTVIVTLEYNHSFPGALKTAIDSLGREWHAKPVGFVSYGGISGGLRAVEAAAHRFLDQLHWWAQTPRTGRLARPYAA